MQHVLILEQDGEVSLAIEKRLNDLGSCSFERVWTEKQALAAAARRPPHLLVVGVLDQGCPLSAARRICNARDLPTIVASRPRPPAARSRAMRG